jgi:hypothetical protein
MDNGNLNNQNAKAPLTDEDRKAIARRRWFLAIVVIDVVLATLLIWAIVELFV